MTESIYVVERHDDGYHGPHTTAYAQSLETALDLAGDMRDDHHGEEWRLRTGSDDDERISFHARSASGWVTIRSAPLRD